ncbi:MAG: HAD family phosphatase [Ktedonobacteraceae bacterium]|nr:HAD family phosphatase [Ktedonobacteraceae bacterium]
MAATNEQSAEPAHPIKLIVIDIDGTLLSPQRTITPRTHAAIQAARQSGIIVTLATGRRYINVAPIADELGIGIPLILCDGSIIIEHPTSNVLFTQPLDASLAQQIVDVLVRHRIQPVVHHMNAGIEESWTGHEEFDTPSVRLYFKAWPENTHRRPHATLCIGQPNPLRVVAFASLEEIYKLSEEISELNCSWNIVNTGNYGSSELAVMNPVCTKASGVQALARYFGIAMEQVMAIGDNNNDVEMLREVGWGVAMGQAEVHVKAAARAVTASNAEDGTAQAIERYALNGSARTA